MISNLFFDLSRPAIFAHRGASAYAPENTLVAFKLAINQRADGIEMDVKLSADKQVVVIHDQTVARTTGAKGWVNRLSLAEIKRLDAGVHFDEAYQGERIPTLEEVLIAFGEQTYINIELTNYLSPNDQLTEKVADLVLKHKLSHRVFFSSFSINIRNLHKMHHLIPEAPLALLAYSGWKGIWARIWLARKLTTYQALHPHKDDVNPDIIKRFQLAGKRIHPYVVNTNDDMQSMFNMGVDGIFTDDPLLARQILANRG